MNGTKNHKIFEYSRDSSTRYTEFDTIGFNSAREAFIHVIKSVEPPLTIGLYGAWGSGKTEMIKGLAEDLGNELYLTLIFDAWKYRYECNLVLPLICALEREYLPADKTKDSARKVITSAVVAMGQQFLKHKTGISLIDLATVLQAYEHDYKYYKKYADQVASIEKEYQDFVQLLLKKRGKQKIIIFIDNLDRCLPDIVVNLLEDISSFLSISGMQCIYMLAMDKENVLKSINHRYPDFDGAHYLEKIVHIAVQMPRPQKRENHDSNYGRYSILKRYERAMGYKSVSKSGDERDRLFSALDCIDKAFGGDILGNPRRAERLVNKLMLLETAGLFHAENHPDDVPMVIFMLLLGEYFSKVYEMVEDNSDFNCLTTYLQASLQSKTSSFTKRKEREHLGAGAIIQNEAILNAYCDDNRFAFFLRKFADLQNIPDLPKKLERIKSYLNLIG